LIESGLQEQRRAWTVRVLEGVKDAEPSTKEDRAHSAHRRRVASQFAEGDVKRQDSEPDFFEVCPVPSITVHADPEVSLFVDEGSPRSPVSHAPSTAITSPSHSPVSPNDFVGARPRRNSTDKIHAMLSDAESRRRRASRRESRRESCATAVESAFMDVDEENTDSLVAVFKMLIDDGEVHVDSLPHALDLMGAHPMKKWLDETLQDVTPHSTLNLEEFITFVQAYKRRQSQEIATAFREIDVDGSGCIDAAELTALLEKLGMTAMDVVIGEILEEVDMNQNGTVEQNEFEYLWILLEKREGFCKREYDRLLEAFCRFDTDHSGSIDREEVMAILNYLNYSLQGKEVHRIFDEVNKSGNGELNETEYMMFMRKVRESEINAMTDCLPRVRFITKKLGLIRMLISLGYLPDDDTLIECAQAVGISLDEETPENADDPFFAGAVSSPVTSSRQTSARKTKPRKRSSIGGFDLYKNAPPVVSIKEAWRFLEFYRSREGMTNAELEYNKEIWNVQPGGETVDALGEKEIETVDAQKAVMWLGWDAPREVQQQLMYDVDVDRSGGISLVEFQKLIRMYREREAASIISVCEEYELPISDCLHPVLKEAAIPLLQALGVSSAKTEDIPTAQSPPPSHLLAPFARQSSGDTMAVFTDIYSIFSIVRQHRREIRKTYRDHEGFGPGAIRDFEVLWSKATGTQPVSEGYRSVAHADDNVVTFRLLKELESAIPEPVFQEMELLEAVREIELNGWNSTFDFSAFVLMMRQAHDTRLRKRVDKEAAAVADTGYSNGEVRDFRKIFIQHDPAGTDRLPFDDLKRILERIAPVGTKLVPKLKMIWKACVKNQCEDMSADFPDFLRIMKECMDCDLISIRSSPKNGTRRNSTARALAAANESV
jgi:Ca2+-binding EF-hand superfamily protein